MAGMAGKPFFWMRAFRFLQRLASGQCQAILLFNQ